MKRASLFVLLAAGLILAVSASGSKEAAAAKAQTLRYAHVGITNEPQTRYAAELAAAVEKKTEGRLKLQVFPSSQLGGVAEMVDGIKSGTIAMGHHDFASLGKIFNDISVFNAPYIYRDARHGVLATNPKTSPVLREINEKLIAAGGMRVVGSFYRGTRELSANFPVYSPADLKGKKIRGTPNQLWMTMIQGMGAIPTPVEIAELHTALMTGLVAGQENPLTNIYAQKFYEVQTHIMMTDHMHSILCTFINEKAWQGIPEGDRKLFEEALQELSETSLKWAVEDEKDIRAQLSAKGMKFIEAKDGLKVDEFRKAVNDKLKQDFPTWTPYIEKIQAIK